MKRRLITLMTAALLALGMMAGPAAADGHMKPDYPGAAHQSIASVLKGDTASIMPGHVVGDRADAAHASIAATLKGDTATIMPDHVRGPR